MDTPDLDLLAIGEALVDFISQEPADSLSAAEQFRRYLGGSPANVAVTVARLCGRAAIASKVGAGAFGRFVRGELERLGVITDYLCNDLAVHTTVIFVARTENMMISLVMLALEAALAAGLILVMKGEGLPTSFQATGPAIGLCVALAFASIAKPLLLKKKLGAPVSGWRWDLAWATSAGVVVGAGVHYLPEPLQLILGIPAILAAFGAVLWTKGFGPEDRELFLSGLRLAAGEAA